MYNKLEHVQIRFIVQRRIDLNGAERLAIQSKRPQQSAGDYEQNPICRTRNPINRIQWAYRTHSNCR